MIIIDGSQSEKSISAFANLEELLKDVMQEDQMTNRVVTDVLVNNEAFSEIYPHQAEDIACSEISSIEVRSVPMAEMAVDMSAEMGKVAQMMAHGSREVARLFRAASDTDALELFQDLLDVTRDFMGMLGELRTNYTDGALPDFAEKPEKYPACFLKWATCWKTKTGFSWLTCLNMNSSRCATIGAPPARFCTSRLPNTWPNRPQELA